MKRSQRTKTTNTRNRSLLSSLSSAFTTSISTIIHIRIAYSHIFRNTVLMLRSTITHHWLTISSSTCIPLMHRSGRISINLLVSSVRWRHRIIGRCMLGNRVTMSLRDLITFFFLLLLLLFLKSKQTKETQETQFLFLGESKRKEREQWKSSNDQTSSSSYSSNLPLHAALATTESTTLALSTTETANCTALTLASSISLTAITIILTDCPVTGAAFIIINGLAFGYS